MKKTKTIFILIGLMIFLAGCQTEIPVAEKATEKSVNYLFCESRCSEVLEDPEKIAECAETCEEIRDLKNHLTSEEKRSIYRDCESQCKGVMSDPEEIARCAKTCAEVRELKKSL